MLCSYLKMPRCFSKTHFSATCSTGGDAKLQYSIVAVLKLRWCRVILTPLGLQCLGVLLTWTAAILCRMRKVWGYCFGHDKEVSFSAGLFLRAVPQLCLRCHVCDVVTSLSCCRVCCVVGLCDYRQQGTQRPEPALRRTGVVSS